MESSAGFFFVDFVVYSVGMTTYTHSSLGYPQLAELLGIKPESLRQKVWRGHFGAPDSHGEWSTQALADLAAQGMLPRDVIVPAHWSPRSDHAQLLGTVRIPRTSAVAAVFSLEGGDVALIGGAETSDEKIRDFLTASSIDIAYVRRSGSLAVDYLVGTGSRLPACAPKSDAHPLAIGVALENLLGLDEGGAGAFFSTTRSQALAWPGVLPFEVKSAPSLDHGLAMLTPYRIGGSLIDADAASGSQIVMDALEVIESTPDVAGPDSIIRKTAREAPGESRTDFRTTFDGYRLSEALRLPWTPLRGSSAHVMITDDATYVCPGRSVDVEASDIRTLTLPDPGREIAYLTTRSGVALPIPRIGSEPARSGIDSIAAAEFAASVLSLIVGNPGVRVTYDREASMVLSTESSSTIEVIDIGDPMPFGKGCRLDQTFTPHQAEEEFNRCGIDLRGFLP